jgi:hypothetical protein
VKAAPASRPKGWGDGEEFVRRRDLRREADVAENVEAMEAALDAADNVELVTALRSELEAAGFPPLLAVKLLSLLDETKLKWAYCKTCRSKVQVDTPDTASIHKAITTAMEYTKGRPAQRMELEVAVSQKPLHEMSDAELEAAARASLNP